jgi:hypothetical protein
MGDLVSHRTVGICKVIALKSKQDQIWTQTGLLYYNLIQRRRVDP